MNIEAFKIDDLFDSIRNIFTPKQVALIVERIHNVKFKSIYI